MLAGGVTAVLLAITFTLAVRLLWPAYSAAEPSKEYSFTMLVARLTVGALCVITAALVATRVARDQGTAAWWVGGVALALSLPIHLVRVWADYPPWYHGFYLAYLLPLAVLTGRVISRRTGGRG